MHVKCCFAMRENVIIIPEKVSPPESPIAFNLHKFNKYTPDQLPPVRYVPIHQSVQPYCREQFQCLHLYMIRPKIINP